MNITIFNLISTIVIVILGLVFAWYLNHSLKKAEKVNENIYSSDKDILFEFHNERI